MKFRIVSALLRSSWAIDERFAIAHGGIIAGMLNGLEPEASDPGAGEPVNTLPYAVAAKAGRKYTAYDDAPKGSIAVIPVRGPLLKDDQEDCGVFSAGMDTLSSRVREADLHSNISGIILYIDSPGGTVDGTQAFADTIKAASKPVVAFIDGIMASAALWIGSSADHIIAQNSTTEIGSIGVMIQFADMRAKWESEGIKFHRIMADQSSDKNKDFIDALDGDYQGIKTQQLNPLAEIFIAAVKSNRPAADNSVFTGKVYLAEDALKLGLIDAIGSLDDAILKAAELSAASPHANSLTSHTMIKLTNLTAALGVEAIEVTDEGAYLNQQQLAVLEERLAPDAGAPIEPDTSEVDALNERIITLEGELAEARRLPGAEPASVSVSSDADTSTEDINAVLSAMSIAERMAYLKSH